MFGKKLLRFITIKFAVKNRKQKLVFQGKTFQQSKVNLSNVSVTKLIKLRRFGSVLLIYSSLKGKFSAPPPEIRNFIFPNAIIAQIQLFLVYPYFHSQRTSYYIHNFANVIPGNENIPRN